jgi:hypothetical protein
MSRKTEMTKFHVESLNLIRNLNGAEIDELKVV